MVISNHILLTAIILENGWLKNNSLGVPCLPEIRWRDHSVHLHDNRLY